MVNFCLDAAVVAKDSLNLTYSVDLQNLATGKGAVD